MSSRRRPRELAGTQTQRTRRGCAGSSWRSIELDGANVRGLRALLALGHVVLDLLVLLQIAETLTGDRAEMHEHVGGAVVRSDEAEALLGAEPLHGSDCHVRSLLSFAVGAWLLPFTAPAVAAGRGNCS